MHKIYIPLMDYPTFNLEAAVCNHGFFMMAPNVWDPNTKTLSRPLRLSDSTSSANVTISQPRDCKLLIVEVHHVRKLYHGDKEAIEAQVSRMMRLTAKDEKDVQRFQQLHPEAKAVKFGRIFRAPSLFEDAVKSVLLCNSNWGKSLTMAKNLCKHGGNFPSARELADVDVGTLEGLKLGYRASHILDFARDVSTGKVKLEELETYESATSCLHSKLTQARGFGDFAAHTLLMCMGFYQHVPLDTETARHLHKVHNIENIQVKIKEAAASVYAKYAPFQCIAFWFELSQWYSNEFGKLSELPSSSYSMVTGGKCRPHLL